MPKHNWPDIEALRAHLDPIVADLGHMPSYCEKERNIAYWIDATQKFGGLRSVARALDYPYHVLTYWGSVEGLCPHLDRIVAEFGWMPNKPDRGARGRDDQSDAISKFAEFSVVAAALGYE